jgi:hypothetical protein
MNMHLKDALIRKVAAEQDEDEDNKEFWARTGKGAAVGAGLGGLAGGSFLGGAGMGAAAASNVSNSGKDIRDVGIAAGGIGAIAGAGIGATVGAIAPHVAVGLMALAKKMKEAQA